MTQQEFEARVKMSVSAEEFEAVNHVYMLSDLDKDNFCKMWVQMNKSRVERAIKEAKAKAVAQSIKDKAWKLYEKLEVINRKHDNYRVIATNTLGKRDLLFLKGEIKFNIEGLSNGQVLFKLGQFLGKY